MDGSYYWFYFLFSQEESPYTIHTKLCCFVNFYAISDFLWFLFFTLSHSNWIILIFFFFIYFYHSKKSFFNINSWSLRYSGYRIHQVLFRQIFKSVFSILCQTSGEENPKPNTTHFYLYQLWLFYHKFYWLGVYSHSLTWNNLVDQLAYSINFDWYFRKFVKLLHILAIKGF